MATEFQDLPEGTVTILFTDTVASTALNQRLGDEAAHGLRQAITALCREQLEKHRGVEVKGTGDGLMLAFQSARRGVRCAQEIQRALAARNQAHPGEAVHLRIGLHTGEVIHDEEDLFGETVVIASRLEGAAGSGEILASSSVHALLGTTRANLEDRGERNLKGIDTPWRVYAVPWEDDGAGPLAANLPTPFTGRSQELAELHQLQEDAARGEGALVLIAGEAGLGKTRLTSELTLAARRGGTLTLVGQCIEGAATPFLPFLEILERLERSLPPTGLREVLGDAAPAAARLVPELRRHFSNLPEPIALPAEQERRMLLNGLCDVFARVSLRQPLTLTLEDLHWADDSTLVLVQHLAPRLEDLRLLVVATYRDDEIHPAHPLAKPLEALRRREHTHTIRLRRFAAADVEAMLQARSGLSPPASFVDVIHRETEGLPLYVEEVYQHLADAGRLFGLDGAWQDDLELVEDDVPQSVRLAIGRRLEQVSPACRHLLAQAATTGRSFTFELLHALEPDDEDAVLDALDEGVAAQLIGASAGESEDRFRFHHELIRQTLLSELTPPRRRRVHARVAEALQQIHPPDRVGVAAEITQHLVQAGSAADPAQTARYAQAAGREAVAATGYAEAVTHFELALEAVEGRADATDEIRCALLLELGDAQRRAAAIKESMESFQAAASLARSLDSVEDFARAALGFEDAYLVSGLPRQDTADPSVMLQEEALKELSDQDSALRAMVLAALARAVHFQGHQEQGLELSGAALEMARRVADRDAVLYALHARRIAIWGPEDLQGRLDVATELMEAAAAAGNSELALDGRQWRIDAFFEQGDLDLVESEIDAFERAADELGQPSLQIYPPMHRGVLALLQGRYDDADRYFREISRIGELAQSENAAIAFGLGRVELEMARGSNPKPEEELLRRFATRHPQIPSFACDLARLLAWDNRHDEARADLSRLVPQADSWPRDNNWLPAIIYLSVAAYMVRDTDSGAVLYQLLEPFAGRYAIAGANHFGAVSRYAGLMATLLERWDVAQDEFERAIEMNIKLEAWPHLAHCRHEYAEMLLQRGGPADHERAHDLLEGAIDAYRELGIVADRVRAEATLEQLRTAPPEAPRHPDGLTPREVEVLRLVGLRSRGIAEDLVIAPATVTRHISNILNKTGLSNRTELSRYASEHGLIDAD